jgi:hypothetical protein
MTAATSDAPTRSWRTPNLTRALYGTVAVIAMVELVLAWNTKGTYDITIWRSFAATVDRVGPIDIYRPDDAGLMVYNHPPLVGWWLMVVNAATKLGVPFGFMIRLPSIIAHVASVFLVYDMVRRRRPGQAVASALAVAVSPLLVIIAGYHGNNDPVVAAFLLASVWLLVDRRRRFWPGWPSPWPECEDQSTGGAADPSWSRPGAWAAATWSASWPGSAGLRAALDTGVAVRDKGFLVARDALQRQRIPPAVGAVPVPARPRRAAGNSRPLCEAGHLPRRDRVRAVAGVVHPEHTHSGAARDSGVAEPLAFELAGLGRAVCRLDRRGGFPDRAVAGSCLPSARCGVPDPLLPMGGRRPATDIRQI